ncbi:putative ferric-chelate reductase 1 [Archocentrus centrarchus]|uniref:putative ferric-chelate reductase 1 n=1 Tax=Archocentrus centrarchus TaxID=63155 RepID=UPI0011EA0381|nr:putative ferric-chelate reductase 1 [Archocentrus centrarchus]
MERGLSLLIATVIIFVASGVQAQSFSFANNTELNITLAGCGVTKLCVSTPSQCNPAGNSNCLFGSVRAGNTSALSGTNLTFELSGDSSGYIALGLTVNPNQGTALLYICVRNSSTNTTIIFDARDWNSTKPLNSAQKLNQTVTAIRGNVNGNKIQCGFTLPAVNSSTVTRSSNSSTTFAILLGSGSYNGGTFGNFIVNLTSSLLNLANPSDNVATPTANATVTNTTGAGGALHPHAVTLSILTLCVLKMA